MGSIRLSGVHYIDSLLWHEYKFGGALGQGATITYTFRDRQHWPDNQPQRFEFSKNQKERVESGWKAWSEIADINWVFSDDQENAQVSFFGWSGPGGLTDPVNTDGRIKWVTFDVPNDGNFANSTYAYSAVLLHEIGHALGLNHTHDKDFGEIADLNIDTTRFSVMSYRSYVGQPIDSGYGQNFYATTPMLHDIAAIQYIYGANINTRTGNDVYNWNNLSAVGDDGQRRILTTIWDAGGTDTIDWSGQSLPAKIDLNPGQWSELGPAYWNGKEWENRNLAIAYNTDPRIDPKITAIENAIGGTGNDALIGNNVDNFLNGGNGDDSLHGNAGNDTIYGEAGNDYLYDGGGNDQLYGGLGNDIYQLFYASKAVITEYANQGNDIVRSAFSYTLGDNLENLVLIGSSTTGNGNSLNNSITGNYVNNVLNGGDGNDLLSGSAGNDEIYGGAGNDYLYDSEDRDKLYGGWGNDTYVLSYAFYPSNAVIIEYVNEGIDTVQASFSYTLGDNLENLVLTSANTTGRGNTLNNRIAGSSFNDTLDGYLGSDTLIGGNGDDKLIDRSGRNFLYGGAGNDYLDVSNSDDVLQDIDSQLFGEFGNDALFGGIGNNYLSGGDGNDLLQDSSGNDTLYGGQGNDGMSSWMGNDILYGEAGEDWLDGAQDNDTLYGGEGNDTLGNSYFPESGNDQMYGEGGNDAIYGGAGNDAIYGNLGTDALYGGSNTDTLIGGDNNDYLTGFAYDSSPEYDALTGGNGADIFSLSQIILSDNNSILAGNYFGTGYATITDFQWSEGDRLSFHAESSNGYSLSYGNWLGTSAQDTAIVYNNNDQICLLQDATLTWVQFVSSFSNTTPIAGG